MHFPACRLSPYEWTGGGFDAKTDPPETNGDPYGGGAAVGAGGGSNGGGSSNGGAGGDKAENQFSLINSLWFTLGSILQQGTGQEPR